VQLKQSPERLRQRNVIEILQNSLQDKPNRSLHGDQETYDEVRYKLIIDPSEDDSLSRLLLMYKILDPKKTKTFMCSDFPEDSQLQKVGSDRAYVCGNLHCVVCRGKFVFSEVHCTHYICAYLCNSVLSDMVPCRSTQLQPSVMLLWRDRPS